MTRGMGSFGAPTLPERLWRLRFAAPPIGDPRPPAPVPPAPPQGEPPAPAAPPASSPADQGFPAGTPLAEMTTEQREAYWKHQARRHEQTWKSVVDKNLTPEQVLEMQQRLETMTRASLSDQERALEDARREAREQATQEVRKETLPRLVAAEFRAAAGGRIPADRLSALLEPLDHTKFLTTAGEVDTDKVQQYVAGLAPADKKWPDMGQGRRESQKATGVGAGRELFASRAKK